jgi:outer membrane protein assembly factor BamB
MMLALAPPFATAQTNVLTYHNDNARTGQNLTEMRLTPANVNSSSFGKLFNLVVDGKVDAQPLYVSGLNFPRMGARNVVFIETEHGSAYAFDADTGAKLWQISTLKAGETTSDSQGCSQVVPEIGITATPVIDLKAGPHGTIYIVAMSKDGAGRYYQRLHALDLTTGEEQFGGPVDIHATYPGTGDTSTNGSVVFDPRMHVERAGLLLVNGVVYTSWTSHCDIRPYNGWAIGYDALTLGQISVFNFAPNGSEASIWNAGAGPASDAAGTLFFGVANGTFDTALDGRGFPSRGNYGNAFVRLQPSASGLQVLDYWTMYNTIAESNRDADLGSGGVMLLPDVQDSLGQVRHLGVGAGKDSVIYVFDRDNMGKFNPIDNSNLYQQLTDVIQDSEFAAPAWFNGTLYFGAVNDNLRALPVVAGRVSSTPSSMSAGRFVYPGTTPSISANGLSNAIVWAAENSDPAVLHAYDATNLNRELYNSNQAPNGRDQFGAGNKFITPTIADGKVFVGTQNSVGVFGLFEAAGAQRATSTSLTSSTQSAMAGTKITFEMAVTAASAQLMAHYQTVTLFDGEAPIARRALNLKGRAQFATSALKPGTHIMTARYAGTGGYLPSVSSPLQVVVSAPSP